MTPHLPSREEVADLLAWAPEHGVLSVCVRVEPGDRSQGWRAELRGALREVEDAAERPARRALAAAAKHVLERFPEGGHPPGESGQIGFVEVGGEGRAASAGFHRQEALSPAAMVVGVDALVRLP